MQSNSNILRGRNIVPLFFALQIEQFTATFWDSLKIELFKRYELIFMCYYRGFFLILRLQEGVMAPASFFASLSQEYYHGAQLRASLILSMP